MIDTWEQVPQAEPEVAYRTPWRPVRRRAAAARRETVPAPSVVARLVRRVCRVGPTALSRRGVEILGLVADGATNAEAARALSIGEAR